MTWKGYKTFLQTHPLFQTTHCTISITTIILRSVNCWLWWRMVSCVPRTNIRRGLVHPLATCSQGVYNILFVAFHSNPVGGHLNAYFTLLCICLYSYSYVKWMCQAWPGCALANPTKGHSCKLVNNFQIKAPFLVLHIDTYSAGAHSGFEGSDVYLVACCSMCTFGALEPVTGTNSATFASVMMKIQLRYRFCHTVVLVRMCDCL